MNHCSHCKVYIRDNKDKCVLCGNKVQIEGDKLKTSFFPKIPPFYDSNMAMKIMAFISLSAIVISFAVNMIFPSNINWPLLVVFGLLSVWLGLFVIIKRRYHIPKKVIMQVVILALLSVFWDWETGWRGWSTTYVIPILIVSAMVIMYVTAKILKLSTRDYITYCLIDGFFGIVPVIFIVFKWVDVVYPSIISIAVSLISLAAIFIFQGEAIKLELNKRMHM